MCGICGCGDALHDASHRHAHAYGGDFVHKHDHPHGHDEFEHTHDHHHTHGESDGGEHSHDHDHDHPSARLIRIEQDILGRNNALAEANRAVFLERGILALNLMSSPGSGKTTLLARTIRDLSQKASIAVIEGDQQTSFDAERIARAGAPAYQVNTGKGCHLDAQMIEHAVSHLRPVEDSVLFIENVGNLVCPAAFDLGEAARIVILSVTEGEDKPLKYPDMFAQADLLIINKIDLLPHLVFDVEKCLSYAGKINPSLQSILLSAATGEGMEQWEGWILAKSKETLARRAEALAAKLAEIRKKIEPCALEDF
ncbi:hydrogenase accessory protein HypB [Alphaproteobacteria bacterium]|nr:hydrogenase accessory protein HypB [Alphaproteobacteria bacterium]